MPVSACSVAVIKAKMNIFLWVMAPSLLLSSRVYVCVCMCVCAHHLCMCLLCIFQNIAGLCIHACLVTCDPVLCQLKLVTIGWASVLWLWNTTKKPDQNIGHAVWSENPSVGCSLGDPRSSVYCMYWCSTVCTWYPGLSRRTYAFIFFSPLVPM